MPTAQDIVTFYDPPVPVGETPWIGAAGPTVGIDIVDPDPAWSAWYDELASRIRNALGWRALNIEHVGSTSVPGLPAKPIIDIDLTVAAPEDEPAYVPALEDAGFELRLREPWWYGHRLLRAMQPRSHVHVFGYDSPELIRHRIFRDWLRGNAADRELYAASKREAADVANSLGEHGMQYNARKERVVREIYHRAFVGTGLLPPAD